jgi:hypothetical protein
LGRHSQQPLCYEEGDSIININTKRSLSINSFTNTFSMPDSSGRAPQSTVNLVDLKNLRNPQNLGTANAFCGLNNENLSSIKPKMRNGLPEVNATINTSDADITEWLGQDKENQHFDIYNKMLRMHGQETPRLGI